LNAFSDLGTSIPIELIDEFLKRLPYVSEGIHNVQILPSANRVAFDLRPGFESQAEVVAFRIAEVAGKLCLNHRAGMIKTLVKRDVLPSFSDDPHPLLTERGELVCFGRGRYGFGPKIVALMEYFELQARRMAATFEAEARQFPSLIGADVLDRCRYLKNFPASLNLVSHLREDHAVLQKFASSGQWDGNHLAFDRDGLSQIECLLSPSVCFHWYMWLRDTELTRPQAITALGKCFRYESSNLSGLERLWDFNMREIIFVGEADYVLNARNRLVDASAQCLDELGMAYEISSASDPFFVDSYAVQAAYQQGFDLKFELLAPLPYSGKKLAVGSINYHQDFFGRSFAIQTPAGPAHTGCLGFGYERLALAFLAQHGLDETHWPDPVARHLRTASA
jgi:seryl-tRNA synthetase